MGPPRTKYAKSSENKSRPKLKSCRVDSPHVRVDGLTYGEVTFKSLFEHRRAISCV